MNSSPAPRLFVIVGQQRTGTTMLARTLNDHEHAICLGELFIAQYPNRYWTSHAEYCRRSVWHRGVRTLSKRYSTRQYLNEIASAPPYAFRDESRRANCRAIGFKLMYGQARRNPAALRWITRRGASVIHLVRTNVLRVLVSREVNQAYGLPHVERPIAARMVNIETDSLLKRLERIDKINRLWERMIDSCPHITVTYEDLVADRDGELERILEFLGLHSDRRLSTPTTKLNPSDLRLVVSNYEQVADALRRSPFERCLES